MYFRYSVSVFCFRWISFFRFIFWSACANSRADAGTFAILDNGLNAARLCARLLIGSPVPPLIRNRTIPVASYLFSHHWSANVWDLQFWCSTDCMNLPLPPTPHTHATEMCSTFNESMFCVSFTAVLPLLHSIISLFISNWYLHSVRCSK